MRHETLVKLDLFFYLSGGAGGIVRSNFAPSEVFLATATATATATAAPTATATATALRFDVQGGASFFERPGQGLGVAQARVQGG